MEYSRGLRQPETHHITLKRRPIPRTQHLPNLPIPTALSLMPWSTDIKFARHRLRRQAFIELPLESFSFVLSRSEVVSWSVWGGGSISEDCWDWAVVFLQLEECVGDLQHEDVWVPVVLTGS